MKQGIALAGLIVGCLVCLVWWQWPSSQVKLTVCDVGQGDGIVLTQGFNQMVVDVGPDTEAINHCLGKTLPFWDRYLESVVITHADADHAGGLDRVLNRYQVGQVMTTEAARARVMQVTGDEVKMVTMGQGMRWDFGKVSGEAVWPPIGKAVQSQTDDDNRQSLVMRLKVNGGADSVWMAADADNWVESHLIAEGLIKSSTYLKVGHHGSSSATSEPFLAILQPRQVWVSVGKNNRYGHPTKAVLQRLMERGIEVRRTDEQGNVSLTLN